MTNEEFMTEVDASISRSKRVLLKKQTEYTSSNRDRLEQFYRAGAAQAIPATSALVGMMAKHFTSVSDLARRPFEGDLKTWNEKLTDLRNYTFLLDALVRDMRERKPKMINVG